MAWKQRTILLKLLPNWKEQRKKHQLPSNHKVLDNSHNLAVDIQGDLFYHRYLQEAKKAHLHSWHKILETSDKQNRYLTLSCSPHMSSSIVVCTIWISPNKCNRYLIFSNKWTYSKILLTDHPVVRNECIVRKITNSHITFSDNYSTKIWWEIYVWIRK